MMTVTVSYARQNLPDLINRAFAGEEFIVVKNKIPMARMSPVGNKAIKKTRKVIVPGATNLLSHLKGSTIEIADALRESAWRGTYDN